jgi:hypothetical protein
MMATAISAEALKEKAGVPNTGRKSKNTVLHLMLSWHPSESENLSQEEMMRAALGAIRALKAEDRQALIVAHKDEEHSHLHVAINRVSPEDGRILPSKYEKRNLSRWAQQYEEERGKIYCPDRIANNAARDRGEFTRGRKDTPRHIYELEAANQNNPGFEQTRKKQKSIDAALAKARRQREARKKEQWVDLLAAREKSLEAIRERSVRELGKAEASVRNEFKSKWLEQQRRHREDLKAFDKRETTLRGRIKNMMQTLDWKGMIRGETRKAALSKSYNMVADAGKRREEIVIRQKAEEEQLKRQQKAAERTRRNEIRRMEKQQTAERRALFLAERHSLLFKHDMENAANQNEWSKRNDDRRRAYESTQSRETDTARSVDQDRNRSASPSDQQTPSPPPQKAEQTIDKTREFKDRMRQRNEEKGRDRGGHDRER